MDTLAPVIDRNSSPDEMKYSMRNTTLLIALLVSMSTTGCFDMNQTLAIRDDNTARYQIEFLIDARLANIGGKSAEFCNEVLIDVAPSLKTTSKKETLGGNVACRIIIDGPIEQLRSLSLTKDESSIAWIESTGNDSFRVSNDFSTPSKDSEQTTPGSLGKEFAEIMAEMMVEAAFAGRALRWDITAPAIIDSNGQISEDGKSVHWELPLTEALSGSGKEHYFYAEFKLARQRWAWAYDAWYWALSFFYSDADIRAKKEGFGGAQEKVAYIKKMKAERERGRKERRLARARKDLEEVKDKIRGLEEKKLRAEKAKEKLAKFKVSESVFFRKESGYGGRKPRIRLTVENNTSHPVSRVYFEGTLQSPGRSVAWLKESFNYIIPGGLEPGETATWELAPNEFGAWGQVKPAADAALSVKVVDVDSADGESLISDEEKFSDDELNRLIELKEKQRKLEEALNA